MTARPYPIFHLSFPVRDLDEAIEFYTSRLGAVLGRKEEFWADVALFGAQVTLQFRPDEVLDPMPRSRHFGATLPWDDWEDLVSSIDIFVEEPHRAHEGSEREQGKAMISDPSGNLVEIKAYRYPTAVLGGLAKEHA